MDAEMEKRHVRHVTRSLRTHIVPSTRANDKKSMNAQLNCHELHATSPIMRATQTSPTPNDSLGAMQHQTCNMQEPRQNQARGASPFPTSP
eukprot:12356543-Alexandrium_andersonii.AAC.1